MSEPSFLSIVAVADRGVGRQSASRGAKAASSRRTPKDRTSTFVLFHDRKACLQAARGEITHFVREQLLLDLNLRASHVAPVTQGLPFLGFRVFPRLLRLKRRGLVGLVRRMRAPDRSLAAGEACEDEVVRSVQSLIGHAAFGNTRQLRRRLFGAPSR